jgi:hypothetical protein
VTRRSGRTNQEVRDQRPQLGRRRHQAEVPFYAQGDVVPPADLTASCVDNVRFILTRLTGDPMTPEDQPRETGMARSAQGAP